MKNVHLKRFVVSISTFALITAIASGAKLINDNRLANQARAQSLELTEIAANGQNFNITELYMTRSSSLSGGEMRLAFTEQMPLGQIISENIPEDEWQELLPRNEFEKFFSDETTITSGTSALDTLYHAYFDIETNELVAISPTVTRDRGFISPLKAELENHIEFNRNTTSDEAAAMIEEKLENVLGQRFSVNVPEANVTYPTLRR